MRVHFDLKIGADTIEQATAEVYKEAAKFLGIDEKLASSVVDMELKVSIPDPAKDSHIAGHFLVSAYGNVKQNILKPT